eukprot:1176853-Prorocentrum_minimum.AAC.2
MRAGAKRVSNKNKREINGYQSVEKFVHESGRLPPFGCVSAPRLRGLSVRRSLGAKVAHFSARLTA